MACVARAAGPAALIAHIDKLMEDNEVIEILKRLLEKQVLDEKEREAVRAAAVFISLALHTSSTMRKTLKRKHDANFLDIDPHE